METAIDPVAVKPLSIRTTRQTPTSVYDLTLDELGGWMSDRGFPVYRAKQLFDGLYRQLVQSFDEITVLPKALRERLAEEIPISVMAPVNEVATPNRDTVKTLYETTTHDLVETVLMIYRDRATVCVSCQVGCGRYR